MLNTFSVSKLPLMARDVCGCGNSSSTVHKRGFVKNVITGVTTMLHWFAFLLVPIWHMLLPGLLLFFLPLILITSTFLNDYKSRVSCIWWYIVYLQPLHLVVVFVRTYKMSSWEYYPLLHVFAPTGFIRQIM